MIWDSYEYKVGTHYLSALINGDASGLSDAESAALDAFEHEAHRVATDAGFTVGHWAIDSNDDDTNFARCEVSGMASDVRELKLMVYKS
jgi:hypothetical protein